MVHDPDCLSLCECVCKSPCFVCSSSDACAPKMVRSITSAMGVRVCGLDTSDPKMTRDKTTRTLNVENPVHTLVDAVVLCWTPGHTCCNIIIIASVILVISIRLAHNAQDKPLVAITHSDKLMTMTMSNPTVLSRHLRLWIACCCCYCLVGQLLPIWVPTLPLVLSFTPADHGGIQAFSRRSSFCNNHGRFSFRVTANDTPLEEDVDGLPTDPTTTNDAISRLVSKTATKPGTSERTKKNKTRKVKKNKNKSKVTKQAKTAKTLPVSKTKTSKGPKGPVTKTVKGSKKSTIKAKSAKKTMKKKNKVKTTKTTSTDKNTTVLTGRDSGLMFWKDDNSTVVLQTYSDDGTIRAVTFCVSGNPRPLSRHRTARGFMYNPSAPAQKVFRNVVLSMIPELVGNVTTNDGSANNRVPPETALRFHPDKQLALSLRFEMRRPKAHFVGNKPGEGRLKKTAPGRFSPIRTDVDNLAKFVMDSLNEFLYEDDRQVATLHATKLLDDHGNCDGRITVSLCCVEEKEPVHYQIDKHGEKQTN